jgi:hypothetical protein
MKIHFDLEATPQELRSFFGLPNLEPLQNEILDTIRQNMSAGMEGFDPASIMKPFLPEHLQGLSALQNSLWQAMLGQSQTHSDLERSEEKNLNQ